MVWVVDYAMVEVKELEGEDSELDGLVTEYVYANCLQRVAAILEAEI